MQIKNHKYAFEIFKKKFSYDVEEFWCLALSSNLDLIECKLIAKGTVDYCHVHPRDVFRFAYIENASKIIIAHNHPTCKLRPSDEDLKLTHQLIKASEILKIPILDHLIISKKSYYSMAENKDFLFTL